MRPFSLFNPSRQSTLHDGERFRSTNSRSHSEIKQFFIVKVYQPGREHLLQYLADQQQLYAEKNLRQGAVGYIAGKSIFETLGKLQSAGFIREVFITKLFGWHVGYAAFS